MDLRLHLRVISRFRWIVLTGAVLALALTFASYYRIQLNNGPKIGYREAETFQSSETLMLTPPGYSLFTGAGQGTHGAASIDTGYLTSLAGIYAKLVNSDVIRSKVKQKVGTHVVYSATPVIDPAAGSLPFVEIDGLATSPARAVQVASTVSSRFLSYVQSNSKPIQPNQRIVVQPVSLAADNVKVVKSRSKTLPIVVFLVVILGTVGLVYILENLRPRATAGVDREHVDETSAEDDDLADLESLEPPRLIPEPVAPERSRSRA